MLPDILHAVDSGRYKSCAKSTLSYLMECLSRKVFSSAVRSTKE
jgi:hypothetical protein